MEAMQTAVARDARAAEAESERTDWRGGHKGMTVADIARENQERNR